MKKIKEQMPYREAFGKNEKRAVMEVIKYYSKQKKDPPYNGLFQKKFCKDFEEYMGGKGFCCAVSSGTSATYVALASLNLPKGSEIIISPVTDSGPLNCIILQGYIPVIADSRKESYNMNLNQIVKKITKKTSAIMAIHSAGEPLEIKEICIEAKKRNVKVIEDCSQAPGARYKGKKVGSFGDVAAFSTVYKKTLQFGGSGGLIYTKSKTLYQSILAHSDRGKELWKNYSHYNDIRKQLFPALNFNINEFSCAIGSASLKRLDQSIKKRNNFLKKLVKALSFSKVCSPYPFNDKFSPFYFPIFVNKRLIKYTKNEFARVLLSKGVNLIPEYGQIVSSWKWARPYMTKNHSTPNAISIRDSSFNLFLNEKYGEIELRKITNTILQVEKKFLKNKYKKN